MNVHTLHFECVNWLQLFINIVSASRMFSGECATCAVYSAMVISKHEYQHTVQQNQTHE